MVHGGQRPEHHPAEAHELTAPGGPSDGRPLAIGDGPSDEAFRIVADHAIFPQVLIDDRGVVCWMSASVER